MVAGGLELQLVGHQIDLETAEFGHKLVGLAFAEHHERGKRVDQGCILSPFLFNLYAEYIMRNAMLNEPQAGIKISGRNINNLRYADNNHTYDRKRRNKEPLDESERGE